MSLWQRVKRLFRAQANAALNALENPEQELAMLAAELRQEHHKARIRLVEALAGLKTLEQEEARIQQEIERWERRATQAVAGGNDELAKQALREKQRVEKTWAVHREELQAHRASIAVLQQAERDLVVEMTAAEKRRQDLEHRLHHAQSLLHLGQALSTKPMAPLGTLAEIEQNVAALEEQVALQQDTDKKVAGVVMEQHLRTRQQEREKQALLQQELAALKKKMKP